MTWIYVIKRIYIWFPKGPWAWPGQPRHGLYCVIDQKLLHNIWIKPSEFYSFGSEFCSFGFIYSNYTYHFVRESPEIIIQFRDLKHYFSGLLEVEKRNKI